jgi:molybdate transport system substrate-binding protein
VRQTFRIGLWTLILLGAGLASWRFSVSAPPARAASSKEELIVFAASSLRDAFEGLAASFENLHPEAQVRLNLAGSQELRIQLEQGARADVFASADTRHMAALQKQALVEKPALFARNEPVIVVPHGNPASIHAFIDLPKTRRLVVGAPEVPIGRYTDEIFAAAARKYGGDLRARLQASIVSRELNVRQVLAKVTLGEADAGIVYRTDARAAGDKVEVVAIPPELNVIAEYPMAVVKGAPAVKLARAWVELVLSPEGQRRLVSAGFVAVPGQAPAR